MDAGGKWWDLKVGFNIAHSQSLCMDSQQDFGENLPTKGHLMEYPMPTQNLPFIFSFDASPPNKSGDRRCCLFSFVFCLLYVITRYFESWILLPFCPFYSNYISKLYFVPFITLMNWNSKSSTGTKKKVVYQRGQLFSIFFGWIILCYRGLVDFKIFSYSMFLCSATSLCPCFVSMDGPSLDLCVRGCKRAVCFSVIGHLKEGAAQLESTLKATTLFTTQLSFLMNILPRCG